MKTEKNGERKDDGKGDRKDDGKGSGNNTYQSIKKQSTSPKKMVSEAVTKELTPSKTQTKLNSPKPKSPKHKHMYRFKANKLLRLPLNFNPVNQKKVSRPKTFNPPSKQKVKFKSVGRRPSMCKKVVPLIGMEAHVFPIADGRSMYEEKLNETKANLIVKQKNKRTCSANSQ